MGLASLKGVEHSGAHPHRERTAHQETGRALGWRMSRALSSISTLDFIVPCTLCSRV